MSSAREGDGHGDWSRHQRSCESYDRPILTTKDDGPEPEGSLWQSAFVVAGRDFRRMSSHSNGMRRCIVSIRFGIGGHIAHGPRGPGTRRAHVLRDRRRRRVAGAPRSSVGALMLPGRPQPLDSGRACSSMNTHASLVRRIQVQLFARRLPFEDRRFPVIYAHVLWANEGGLMSYASDPAAEYRRAAGHADRIFKGAKPADSPSSSPPSLNWSST